MGWRHMERFVIACLLSAAWSAAYAKQATGGYQVKACSLMSLAEMKKLAPWPSSIDQSAKAEEVALPQRSLCVYPTAQVQIESYRPQIVESARKTARLDPVPGVGDEAYIRNNQNLFAVIYAKVGPHLLTVEMEIPVGQTFETAKPTIIEIAKAFAARLR